MSTERSQARDAIAHTNSTSNGNNGVAVPKDGMPPTSDANSSTGSHDNMHHLYAGMHSLIDTLVCTPSSLDR
ncbi:MAG TPA: hypothetical protein V6D48_08980 [Oculatellaceae cyanobacterium]